MPPPPAGMMAGVLASRAMAALRDGRVDAIAVRVHTTLTAFSSWHGAQLVVALAQGTPWLLVLRADIRAQRGDLSAVKGLPLGAAPAPSFQALATARPE